MGLERQTENIRCILSLTLSTAAPATFLWHKSDFGHPYTFLGMMLGPVNTIPAWGSCLNLQASTILPTLAFHLDGSSPLSLYSRCSELMGDALLGLCTPFLSNLFHSSVLILVVASSRQPSITDGVESLSTPLWCHTVLIHQTLVVLPLLHPFLPETRNILKAKTTTASKFAPDMQTLTSYLLNQ